MVDNCDMLLRAAQLLDHTKLPQVFEPPRVYSDDFAVPDTDLSFMGSSPPAFDDDFDDEPMDFEDDTRKRPRMAALKGSRSFLARDAVAHNSVEKRRRAYLASCYEGLKNSIPALANSRASNVKVLRGGAALIKALETEERRLLSEKKRLIVQRDTLQSQNIALSSSLKALSRRSNEQAVPTLSPMTTHVVPQPHVSETNDEAAMSLMMLAELCPK